MKTFNKYLGKFSRIFKETAAVGGTVGDLGAVPKAGVAKKGKKEDGVKKIKH